MISTHIKLHHFFILVVIIILLFSSISFSQYINYSISNLEITNVTKNDNLSNLPFQIGMEYGTAIPLKEKKFFKNGYWAYGNINLFRKSVFLRLAYGSLNTNEELGNNSVYLSFGMSLIPFQYKQHSISLNGGFCFYSYSKSAGILAISAGLNYLYRLNPYMSLSAGIQMPVIRSPHYNEYYHNSFLIFGFQLF